MRRAQNRHWMFRKFAMMGSLCSVLLWAGAAFGQSTDSFTFTSAMNNARANHTATKLSNGMVLIAGGYNGSVLATAELYDSTTGVFTVTGSLVDAREYATATLLNNGMVLITGGYNGTAYLKTAEVYNPTTGTFALTTGNMQKERSLHTATLLANGTVLIDGGCNESGCITGSGNGTLNTAEIFNPTTEMFAFTNGNMHKERAGQSATLLSSGEVLIAGGYNCNPTQCYLPTAEIYNPSTGNFSYTTGNMLAGRAFQTATLLSGGTVLIAGGYNGSTALSDAEIYNPSTETFAATTGSLNAARELHTATLLGDGTVLVAGGYNLSSYLSSAELYSPTAGTFATIVSMNAARAGQTATAITNDTVLVAGGYSGSYLASAEIFSNLVQGYIDPKYVVVGVTYAAPGPSSNTFVSYTNSTMIGTTNSLSNTFMSSDSYSVALTTGFNIPMVANGKITDTYSDMSSETTKSTTSVTMSFQTSTGEKTFGTGSYWAPVDNDYDTIWVWLNPALIFSVSSNGTVTWNGYGIDKTDQPGMDIYGIELGYLNGDFGKETCDGVLQQLPCGAYSDFLRSWASTQLPTGQNPALTTADYAQIATFDPFSVSTYGTNQIGYSPPSPSTPDNRFTLSSCTELSSFDYEQAAPSQSAAIYTCALNYTNTSTQSQDITSNYMSSFSIDAAYSATPFDLDIGVEIKAANTLSWTVEEQSSITATNTMVDSLSVQGPPCNNVNQGVGPCVPVYDSGGNEPTEYYVYQDNMYGTFMFAPVHYY